MLANSIHILVVSSQLKSGSEQLHKTRLTSFRDMYNASIDMHNASIEPHNEP